MPSGKTLYVDNGLFFAAHEKTKFKIGVVGGVKTFIAGGMVMVMVTVTVIGFLTVSCLCRRGRRYEVQ